MRFLNPGIVLSLLAVIFLSCNSPGTAPVDLLPDTNHPVMPGSVFASVVGAEPIPPLRVDEACEALPFRQAYFIHDLSGQWKYRADLRDRGEDEDPPWYSPELSEGGWGEMSVPSHFTREDESLSDFYQPVWFRRIVSLTQSDLDRATAIDLFFEGVDYFAEVWLNGTKLGEHEGYFNPFRFGVMSRLHPGDNLLVVKVINPYDYGLKGSSYVQLSTPEMAAGD